MRILIVQSGSLKHLLFSLPVLSDLRRQYPELKIDCCVDAAQSAIIRCHPAANRILPVAFKKWRKKLLLAHTWREIRAFLKTLQTVDYDAVLDVHGTLSSALIARRACGPTCGFDIVSARQPWAARCYDVGFTIPRIVHPVERKRWLAAAAIELPLETPLDYGLNIPPLAADWLPRQEYVVLLLPPENNGQPDLQRLWLPLAQALQARGYAIVLSADTVAPTPPPGRAIPHTVIAPSPSALETVAALLAGANGVIGGNSELTHLAAALGRPVICLHSGDNPELSGVLGVAPFRNLSCSGKIPEVSVILNAFLTCAHSCPASSTPCSSPLPCPSSGCVSS